MVESILNRAAAVRVSLEEASPDMQLLDSLAPMWQVMSGGRGGGALVVESSRLEAGMQGEGENGLGVEQMRKMMRLLDSQCRGSG